MCVANRNKIAVISALLFVVIGFRVLWDVETTSEKGIAFDYHWCWLGCSHFRW
jgi:hypothetical protein